MAVYLPLITVLLTGGGAIRIIISIPAVLAATAAVLFVAVRYRRIVSGWVAHESDEVVLLTIFALVLLSAGLAQRMQISAAVAAYSDAVAPQS